ncbi:MFS transporter [Micromonospora fluostatini]
MLKDDLAVLRNRQVAALLTARSISLLGNAIMPIALAFAILRMPGASATSLGLVLMARTLTQVTLVLIGGVIADRLPRYRVMVSAEVAAGLAQTATAVLLIGGNANIPAIALLAALNGGALALFEPASRSMTPQLVPPEALQSANALLKFAMRAGTIVGAALAGVLIAAFGPGVTLGVNAATFFISALVLLTLRPPRQAPVTAPSRTLLSQVLEGWKEFTSRQWVWAIVGQLAFVNILLSGGFYVIGPVVAERSLGGAPAWSAVLTAQAVGFIAGTVVAIRYRPRYPARTAALLTAAFALPLFLLAGPVPVVALAIGAFTSAICIDVYEVTVETALQRNVPPEALSRVMSYEALGSFAFVPLGVAIAGPVADAVGTRTALLGAGSLIVASGLLVLLLPSVRHVRATPTTVPAQPQPDSAPEPDPVAAEPRAGGRDGGTDTRGAT